MYLDIYIALPGKSDMNVAVQQGAILESLPIFAEKNRLVCFHHSFCSYPEFL